MKPHLVWFLKLALSHGALAQAAEDAKVEATFAGRAAWQADEELGRRWQEITGRFIFQRSCLSCHRAGPVSYTRSVWKQTLSDFPDEGHQVLLTAEYDDLTAAFSYGKMMPDGRARAQALESFVMSRAPTDASDIKDEPVDLLPQVGQRAPDFSILDSEGVRRSLGDYIRDQRALILVFSRAHW